MKTITITLPAEAVSTVRILLSNEFADTLQKIVASPNGSAYFEERLRLLALAYLSVETGRAASI